MSERAAEAVPPWDAPWDFTVTWSPESGPLPLPILRLFRGCPDIVPGKAIQHTDRGHSTHYAKAVRAYVEKYHPERTDITADAILAQSAAPESPAAVSSAATGLADPREASRE